MLGPRVQAFAALPAQLTRRLADKTAEPVACAGAPFRLQPDGGDGPLLEMSADNGVPPPSSRKHENALLIVEDAVKTDSPDYPGFRHVFAIDRSRFIDVTPSVELLAGSCSGWQHLDL